MLSDMSHRYLTVAALVSVSGSRRQEVRAFVDMLDARGVLLSRECPAADSAFASLQPLGSWLRRTFAGGSGGR